MKKTIIIFLTVLSGFVYSLDIYSQEYWIQQASPTNKYLRSIFFTDSLKGWISGDSGLIIHTTNSGESWNIQQTGLLQEVHSLFFVNERKGYALSWEFDATPPNFYGTRILSTTNGGLNWQNYLYPDTNLFLNTIYFLDSLNGFAGGTEGTILYTTNSGNFWQESVVDSSSFLRFPVNNIKFFDNVTGYAVGGAFDIAGLVWKTTSSGRRWTPSIVGPEPLKDLHIYDSNNIISVGGDFEYGPSKVTTTNSGSSWEYFEFGIIGIASSISFRTPSEGWISIGLVDSLLMSTNSGMNWRVVAAPGGAKIFALNFIDSRNGWAAGNEGVILKYNSNISKINTYSSTIPQSPTLYQNYPNPFNPNTVISYHLPASSDVLLKVFDVTGKEVAVLVNEQKSSPDGPGNYSVEFDGSYFPSGVYFYTLESNGIKLTKRMLLIK